MDGLLSGGLGTLWPAIIGGVVIAFHFVSRFFNERQARREGKEEGAREIADQIQEQTNERVEAAREAIDDTERLNASELRRLAAESRNNLGRVRRSAGD